MIFRKNLSDSLQGLRLGFLLWAALAVAWAIVDLFQSTLTSAIFAVPAAVASGYYIAFLLVEANERLTAQIITALEGKASA